MCVRVCVRVRGMLVALCLASIALACFTSPVFLSPCPAAVAAIIKGAKCTTLHRWSRLQLYSECISLSQYASVLSALRR